MSESASSRLAALKIISISQKKFHWLYCWEKYFLRRIKLQSNTRVLISFFKTDDTNLFVANSCQYTVSLQNYEYASEVESQSIRNWQKKRDCWGEEINKKLRFFTPLKSIFCFPFHFSNFNESKNTSKTEHKNFKNWHQNVNTKLIA